MKSHVTNQFIKRFNTIPLRIQRLARKNYKLWKENHYHPGLKFKEVKPNSNIYSVRIGIGWSAVGIVEANTIIWFWVGSHSEYDKIVEKI